MKDNAYSIILGTSVFVMPPWLDIELYEEERMGSLLAQHAFPIYLLFSLLNY